MGWGLVGGSGRVKERYSPEIVISFASKPPLSPNSSHTISSHGAVARAERERKGKRKKYYHSRTTWAIKGEKAVGEQQT